MFGWFMLLVVLCLVFMDPSIRGNLIFFLLNNHSAGRGASKQTYRRHSKLLYIRLCVLSLAL